MSASADMSSWGWVSGWVGTIPLRIGAGLVLIYLHAWRQAVDGWQHLAKQTPWGLPELLKKATLPYPDILAYVATVLAMAAAVSWLMGFLTRFFSFLFLLVALGGILAANSLNDHVAAETSVLYLFVALTLLITGSGWFSVDALFELRSRKNTWRPK